METWQVGLFVLASAALVYVSRRSLARPRTHGFYRFFAWELILALWVLVLPVWFTEWRAWHQLLSWLLLAASLVPLWLGAHALRERGVADARRRGDPELIGFERTTQLVTDGVYGHIRHPLYASLLLLDWGLFFKQHAWLGLLLATAASLLLVATARCDEAECLQAFGPDYRRYMQRTRMFIPYVF